MPEVETYYVVKDAQGRYLNFSGAPQYIPVWHYAAAKAAKLELKDAVGEVTAALRDEEKQCAVVKVTVSEEFVA